MSRQTSNDPQRPAPRGEAAVPSAGRPDSQPDQPDSQPSDEGDRERWRS